MLSTLILMVHSTSLPSIASKPSEIPVTCSLASLIISRNCSKRPMTPSPPDSPNVSSDCSPREVIAPIKLSASSSPLLLPPDSSPSPPPEPIAVETSLTACSRNTVLHHIVKFQFFILLTDISVHRIRHSINRIIDIFIYFSI